MPITLVRSANPDLKDADQVVHDNLDLHLGASSLAFFIDTFLKLLIGWTLLLSPLPLVVVAVFVIKLSSITILNQAVSGHLVRRNNEWYLNKDQLQQVEFHFMLFQWAIAIRDREHGWRLLWRDSCEEGAYRRFIVGVESANPQQ